MLDKAHDHGYATRLSFYHAGFLQMTIMMMIIIIITIIICIFSVDSNFSVILAAFMAGTDNLHLH